MSLVTLGMSLTIGAPIFAKALRPDISFSSGWFIGALIVFGALVLCGLVARVRGVLILPDPGLMYEKELSKSPWRFKVDAIHFAGMNFSANAEAVNRKGNWSIALTVLLVTEVLLLVGWIAR